MNQSIKTLKNVFQIKDLRSQDCKHVSKEEWNTIMKAIESSNSGSETIKSIVLVDGFNTQPLYIPSHDFRYYFPFNEFDELPPLFFEDHQYLEWLVKKLRKESFFLRIHVCNPIEIMKKVVIKFKEIIQISCHFFILNNDCIKFLVKYFPNIQAISFENSIGIKLDDCLLLSQLPSLKHLNLMGSDIYEESLQVLLKNCHQLKSLNINNNSGITGHCLVLINKSIERLDLRDCWRIDSERIIAMVGIHLQMLLELLVNSGISDQSLIEICDKCPNIRHLTVAFDFFSYNDFYGRRVLFDSGFSAIGKLEDLKILNVRHVGKLTDQSLQNILKGCKNLTQLVLNVRHRHQLTDEALGEIGIWCPKLDYFESVHNHFIGQLSIYCISKMTNLVALILRGNKNVDNNITRVVSECKKLIYLNLDGCNVDQLVLMACIHRAKQLKPSNEIFRVSMISTNVDRLALNENVLPPNLRIKVSGPNNFEHFSEYDGQNILTGKLSWFFPHYWADFN